jgi:hypothetical protein
MLIEMTFYCLDGQPRNCCNDIAFKIMYFITKYGYYIIGKYITRKIRYWAIVSNFRMILGILFDLLQPI